MDGPLNGSAASGEISMEGPEMALRIADTDKEHMFPVRRPSVSPKVKA